MSPSSGTRIGPFRILEKLGQGGERTVFKAACEDAVADIQPGETVALCCLVDREPGAFEREARILAGLDHPHILRFRHSFAVAQAAEGLGQLGCLVTEFLDGMTLKAAIAAARTEGGVPWPRARHWMLALLDALEYASGCGVIHRDLKPANIFVTSEGVAKLIDFGIAGLRRDDAEIAYSKEVHGSRDYMAPDFVRLPSATFQGDELSDIFSFGVCIVELLTGDLPFDRLGGDGESFGFQKRWSESAATPRPRLRHAVFRVFPGLRDLVSRCLDPDRTKRPSSFAEIRRELQGMTLPTMRGSDPEESFEYVQFLGEGGFGEVFKAIRRRGAEQQGAVAVKHLKASVTCQLGAQSHARFEREANLLRELSHPHLVSYVDFRRLESVAGTRHCLVLEYLEGMPEAGLRSRIARSKSGLDPIEVFGLFDRYLEALGFLHRRNIIHRDIKPHNLYAPEKRPDRAKIFDLGIALDLESAEITSGPIPGSWDYMPPEFASQGQGRGTPRSDLYSLGVALYQALTGHLPFPRIASADEFCRHAAVPRPIAFDDPVFRRYPSLADVLGQFMATRPSERFADARAAQAALRQVGNSGGPKPERNATHSRTRRQETDSPTGFRRTTNDREGAKTLKRSPIFPGPLWATAAAAFAAVAAVALVDDARLAKEAGARVSQAQAISVETSPTGVPSPKKTPTVSHPTASVRSNASNVRMVPRAVAAESGARNPSGSGAGSIRIGRIPDPTPDLSQSVGSGLLVAVGEDALDRELNALLVWFALRENPGDVRNPEGYQPEKGYRSEKLVNTPRARLLPSWREIASLRARFQKAGKLTRSNQVVLDGLQRAARKSSLR